MGPDGIEEESVKKKMNNSGRSRISRRGGVDSQGGYISKILYVKMKESGSANDPPSRYTNEQWSSYTCSNKNRSQQLNQIVHDTEEQVMGNMNTTKEHAINEEGMLNEVIIDGVKYKVIPLECPSEDASKKET